MSQQDYSKRLTWSSELSVGDDSIDDDHKELFDLINALEAADISHDYINRILDQLKKYTLEHFSKEEEYMQKCNYPELKEHAREHRMFIEWLETIRSTYARFPQSPFVIGDLVNDYLQKWLRNHILQEDMKYRDFMAQ